MPSLNEQELGTALWAFAKWGRTPSEEWLSRYVGHLQVGWVARALCTIQVSPSGRLTPVTTLAATVAPAQVQAFGSIHM